MNTPILLIFVLIVLNCFTCGSGETHRSVKARGFGPGEQEYGHITIRNGAHVFFWLYYAQVEEDFLTRPTVVFLSGGPGLSSTGVGNFGETGPLYANGTERVESWAKHVNVLYIDQPIGTGFSIAYNETVLQIHNIDNGADLAQFMISFFNFYPRLHNTPFYFYTEGFGGKNMVELSYQLNVAIREERIAMDFRGIVLAGPWISPADIYGSWGQYLMDKKIINDIGLNNIAAATKLVDDSVGAGNWAEAADNWLKLLDVVDRESGGVDFLNINRKARRNGKKMADGGLFSYITIEEDAQIQELMNYDVRLALDVMEEANYDSMRQQVFDALRSDFLFPVINVISDLLRDSELEITFVTGGLDLLAATPGFEKWINGMTWPGSNQWFLTPKSPFIVGGETVGTMRHSGNLTMYWIDQAGHMIPRDQPAVGLELLRLFSHYDT